MLRRARSDEPRRHAAAGRAAPAASFTKPFTSKFVNAGGLRQHVVIGGDGPPLLLVHGWPENWYQYRALMPALARDFTVIAVDQRGMGLTDKPTAGTTPRRSPTTSSRSWTRSGTSASPSWASTRGWWSATPWPPITRTRRAPGRRRSPAAGRDGPRPLPLFLPGPAVPQLWHLTFNRLDGFNEQLVRGREDLFFSYIFDVEAAIKLPGYAVRYYAKGFGSSRAALSGSFGFYRAWDATSAQNRNAPGDQADDARPGRRRWDTSNMGGSQVLMQIVASDVRGLVIPGAGHFPAEEAPRRGRGRADRSSRRTATKVPRGRTPAQLASAESQDGALRGSD